MRISDLKFKLVFSFLFCILFFVFFSGNILAAHLYFKVPENLVGVGQIIPVNVFLDTGGEDINALEIGVDYSRDLLKLKDWSDGNSVVNLWMERPGSDADKLIFSGLIPGGYNGKRGLLVTLNFETLKEGRAGVSLLDSSEMLLSDGAGTPAKLSINDFWFYVKEGASKLESDKKKDSDSPEDFKPEIDRDDSVFDGKYFLIFATQDKDSGVDYYEVKEGEGGFERAESPYLIRNQRKKQEIEVRAVDKDGNERASLISFVPVYPFWNGGIIIAVIMILLLISSGVYIFKKKN